MCVVPNLVCNSKNVHVWKVFRHFKNVHGFKFLLDISWSSIFKFLFKNSKNVCGFKICSEFHSLFTYLKKYSCCWKCVHKMLAHFQHIHFQEVHFFQITFTKFVLVFQNVNQIFEICLIIKILFTFPQNFFLCFPNAFNFQKIYMLHYTYRK